MKHTPDRTRATRDIVLDLVEAPDPDLLDALKDAEAGLEYYKPKRFHDVSHRLKWNAQMGKIRAAIARAEGRTE